MQIEQVLKVDITEMLMFFDTLEPATNEERKIYWFKTLRPNGLKIVFIISIYENSVSVSIRDTHETFSTSVCLENCAEIRVLDQKRKCLEIIHEDPSKGRCFLSLLDEVSLEYEEKLRGPVARET